MDNRRIISIAGIIISLFARGIQPAQWTGSSLPDESVMYACVGESVSMTWDFTLATGESLEDVQWFYQGRSTEMIAVLTHSNFLPLPAYSHRVRYIPNSGIILGDVVLQDSGNYTVEITGYSGNAFFKLRRTMSLQVGADLMTADTRLHVSRNPEAVLDKRTSQWFVEFRCGNFTYLGQPPFDVEWTTPSGHRRSSSGYEDGQFKLLVKADGFKEGNYYCKVPLSAFATACLATGNSTENSTSAAYTMNVFEVRLMVLEGQQKVLQKESQELKEENVKLKQEDSYIYSVHTALMETRKNLTDDVNSSLERLTQRLQIVEDRPIGSTTSGRVSFHARHVATYKPQHASPLIFQNVLVNHGNAYDFSTGAFTAPFNGTYFLVAAIAPHATNNQVSLYMVVDDVDVSSGSGCGNGCGSSISVHAVVDLAQGAQAWVRVEGDLFLNQGTSFSGFLLSPDF